MLTLFATAKPFRDHAGIIQRNAIRSWTRLHPNVEVILFGDDEGAAEIAREFGLRHEPYIQRNEFGTKRLDYMFARAQELARNELLCYANCDIILFPEICDAISRVSSKRPRFLMVGRRWDTDITEPLAIGDPEVDAQVLQLAHRTGVQRGPDAVDYFAFRRGLYSRMPELVIGRVWWDHWLVWKAWKEGATVVDVSPLVTAVHQNHGYAYHPAGAKGVWTDEQANRNWKNAGGRWHLFTIQDATHVLDENGMHRNWKAPFAPLHRYLAPHINPYLFKVLDVTRPLRHALGLRSTASRLGSDHAAQRGAENTQSSGRSHS